VDAGTGNYTGDFESRNLFRSTAFHNTIRIDGQEINSFNAHELFKRSEEASPRVLSYGLTEGIDTLVAEHYGYQKLPEPVIHCRKFVFKKKEFLLRIEDLIRGKGIHSYEIYFHLAPVPYQFEKNTMIIAPTGLTPVRLWFESAEAVNAEIKDGWISPSFGKRIKAPYLFLWAKAPTPFYLTTIFSWAN